MYLFLLFGLISEDLRVKFICGRVSPGQERRVGAVAVVRGVAHAGGLALGRGAAGVSALQSCKGIVMFGRVGGRAGENE